MHMIAEAANNERLFYRKDKKSTIFALGMCLSIRTPL